jgi:hypothetical protein
MGADPPNDALRLHELEHRCKGKFPQVTFGSIFQNCFAEASELVFR